MTAPQHKFCVDHHKATGCMTNQPDAYDSSRSHASVWVCDGPECRRIAQRYIERFTKEPAVFRPFGKRVAT